MEIEVGTPEWFVGLIGNSVVNANPNEVQSKTLNIEITDGNVSDWFNPNGLHKNYYGYFAVCLDGCFKVRNELVITNSTRQINFINKTNEGIINEAIKEILIGYGRIIRFRISEFSNVYHGQKIGISFENFHENESPVCFDKIGSLNYFELIKNNHSLINEHIQKQIYYPQTKEGMEKELRLLELIGGERYAKKMGFPSFYSEISTEGTYEIKNSTTILNLVINIENEEEIINEYEAINGVDSLKSKDLTEEDVAMIKKQNISFVFEKDLIKFTQ